MKYKIKQAWKSIKIYTSLPHIWVFGIILILSIIACICSVIYMKTNTFLSSIFANIFAGFSKKRAVSNDALVYITPFQDCTASLSSNG